LSLTKSPTNEKILLVWMKTSLLFYILCQSRSHKSSTHDSKPCTLKPMNGRLLVLEAEEQEEEEEVEEEMVEMVAVIFRINLARGAKMMTRGFQTRIRGGGLERGRLQASGRRSPR